MCQSLEIQQWARNSSSCPHGNQKAHRECPGMGLPWFPLWGRVGNEGGNAGSIFWLSQWRRGTTTIYWVKAREAKYPAICRTSLYDKGLSPTKRSVRETGRPRMKEVMKTKNLPVGRKIFNIIIFLRSTFKRSLKWMLRSHVSCFFLFFTV